MIFWVWSKEVGESLSFSLDQKIHSLSLHEEEERRKGKKLYYLQEHLSMHVTRCMLDDHQQDWSADDTSQMFLEASFAEN